MKQNDELLTLKEVADLTKYKLSYLYKVYHFWRDRGVRIITATPNASPRFYKTDILKMMEARK